MSQFTSHASICSKSIVVFSISTFDVIIHMYLLHINDTRTNKNGWVFCSALFSLFFVIIIRKVDLSSLLMVLA